VPNVIEIHSVVSYMKRADGRRDSLIMHSFYALRAENA